MEDGPTPPPTAVSLLELQPHIMLVSELVLLPPVPDLALGRPASQSKELWSYGPELGVDGSDTSCSFTTPQQGEGAWWKVETSIYLYNPG